MRNTLSILKWVALLVTLVFVVAACGDDDNINPTPDSGVIPDGPVIRIDGENILPPDDLLIVPDQEVKPDTGLPAECKGLEYMLGNGWKCYYTYDSSWVWDETVTRLDAGEGNQEGKCVVSTTSFVGTIETAETMKFTAVVGPTKAACSRH